jgi:TonB family protein
MQPATSLSAPDVAPSESGSLTPLCLGHDEDQGWRHLAWVNALCGLTLLVAAGQWWSHQEIRELRAGNTLVNTPVELVLMPEAATDTAKPAAAVPLARSTDSPNEVSAPAVTAIMKPTLAQPVAITSVRPAVGLDAATTTTATTASSTAASGTDAMPSAFNLVAGDRRTPHPRYPELARRRGQTGTVRIEFAVAANGLVSQAEVARSSGFPLLDAAALNTVRTQWQIPASAGRRHYVDIVFQLRRGDEP